MRSIIAGAAIAACIGAFGCEGMEPESTMGARGAASAPAVAPAAVESPMASNETVIEVHSGVQTAAQLAERWRLQSPVTSSRPLMMRRQLPERNAQPGGVR